MRVRGVLLLIKVAGDKALHGGGQRRTVLGAVEDLKIYGGKVVVGVGIKLALVLGQRLNPNQRSAGIGV